MKKKYCFGQSWVNMQNLWYGHEICQDYMFIVCPKSWDQYNLIEKDIDDK